jgi:hypothetical protein
MQVSELEKRESRLKEVFKTQVSNFREACYCLFGYRVDMASQVIHRVSLLKVDMWECQACFEERLLQVPANDANFCACPHRPRQLAVARDPRPPHLC